MKRSLSILAVVAASVLSAPMAGAQSATQGGAATPAEAPKAPEALKAPDALKAPETSKPAEPSIGMKKVAYLGVITAEMDPLLSPQMALDQGIGLLIKAVAPQSPAEEAGVKIDDLLLKLDDQLMVNSAQLQTLVRLHKTGDSVTLTVRRDGKDMILPAKLAEHEVPVLSRRMVILQPRIGQLNGEAPMDLNVPMIDLNLRNSATIVSTDQDMSVTCSLVEDHMEVTATKDGKILYRGSVVLGSEGNLDDNANKDVPPDVLKRLHRLVDLGGPIDTLKKSAETNSPATKP